MAIRADLLDGRMWQETNVISRLSRVRTGNKHDRASRFRKRLLQGYRIVAASC